MDDSSSHSIEFDSLSLNEKNKQTTITDNRSRTIDNPLLPYKSTMLSDSISNENHCSVAGTVSTASASSLWGGESSALFCEYSMVEDELLCIDAASKAQATDKDDPDEDDVSLTLDDIQTFFIEDQVDPRRSPPPLARTDFKGDSQTSFTLDDLAEAADDDLYDESEYHNGRNRRSRRRRRRRSSLFQPSPGPCGPSDPPTPLKGILKQGSQSDTQSLESTSLRPGNARRSSSLAMMLMDDSNFFDLSNGSLEGFDFGVDSNDEERSLTEDPLAGAEANGWSLLQQSFSANNSALDDWKSEYFDDDSDIQKSVTFSSVRVHYHQSIAGDNPSVSEGVPLSLAWEAVDSQTYASLDTYEEEEHQQKQKLKLQNTAHRSRPRQSGMPLQEHQSSMMIATQTQMARTAPRRLDAEERMFLLLASGVPLEDIQEAECAANDGREEREATKQQHMLLGSYGKMFPNSSGALLRAMPKTARDDSDAINIDDADDIVAALGRTSE